MLILGRHVSHIIVKADFHSILMTVRAYIQTILLY